MSHFNFRLFFRKLRFFIENNFVTSRETSYASVNSESKLEDSYFYLKVFLKMESILIPHFSLDSTN